MKTRIITATVAVSLLIGVLLADAKVLGVLMFLLSVVAMHEFIECFKNTNYKPIKSVMYVSTLGLIMVLLKDYIQCNIISLACVLYLLIIVLSFPLVFRNDKYNISDIAITIFGILYIPFLFSFLTLTRDLDNGVYYIWIIFIGACVTDTFAYFVGCGIGRHKLAPRVSPKKTIEGAVGGILGTVVVMFLYGVYLNSHVNTINISILHFIILGLVTSVVAQLGDLFASSIKRYVNVKDYGKILPGHGGILDRFDSIMFIAPIVYLYLKLVGGM